MLIIGVISLAERFFKVQRFSHFLFGSAFWLIQNCAYRGFEDFSKFCKEARLDDAIELAKSRRQQGISITRDNAYYLLQSCHKRKDLECVRQVNVLIVQSGLTSVAALGDHLIRLFASHGSLLEANKVINVLGDPSAYTWEALILANAKLDQSPTALELYHIMILSSTECDQYVYCALLKACIMNEALPQGRLVHEQVKKRELKLDIVLGSALVDMYAKCGSLDEARETFDKLHKKDAVSWGAMIAGYAQCGECSLALECFEAMQVEGMKPNVVSWGALIAGYAQHGEALLALECFQEMQDKSVTPDEIVFLSALRAAATLGAVAQGRIIHEQIRHCGLEFQVVMGSTLVDMYAKCGSLYEASDIFYAMPSRNIVSWNAMMAAYVQHGENHLALECLDMMQQEGLQPNVVSWNTIISGYTQHGEGPLALKCFDRMKQEGIMPDTATFLSLLKACATVGGLEQGRVIHQQIITNNLQSDIAMGSTLIDMYTKSGSIGEACRMFNEMPNRNVVSWNAIIAGCAQHGEADLAHEYFVEMQQEGTKRNVVSWNAMIAGYTQGGMGLLALECFIDMQQDCIKPNEITFSSSLKACASTRAIMQGRLIHAQTIKSGFWSSIAVGNVLIDMYAKCGHIKEAAKVFYNLRNGDIIAWGALITGYVHCGLDHAALDCFKEMQQEGIKTDEVIFLTILKACANIEAIVQGKIIHAHVIYNKFQFNIIGSALVGMYAKCGRLQEAHRVFHEIPNPDIILWNSMIAGYSKHGEGILAQECLESMKQHGIMPNVVSWNSLIAGHLEHNESPLILEFLKKMQQEDIKCNEVTFSSILKACADLGAIDQGKLVHEQIIKAEIHSDIIIGNSLIDMYGKCGELDEARKLFDIMSNRDCISWSTMIAAYAQYGNGLLALECFQIMQRLGIQPDELSITSILIGCSRLGFVEEGYWYFKLMTEYHDVQPSTCLVDLLGRAGCLSEAEKLLRTTMDTDVVAWTSLLGACRIHGSVEVGRHCFDEIVSLDPSCIAAYVQLSNIYADAHMQMDVCRVEKLKNVHVLRQKHYCDEFS